MTDKANGHRGEVAIMLLGQTYKLVPNYENLAALEEAADASLLDLATRLQNRRIRIGELSTIIATTAEPGIDAEKAGKAILEEGIVKTIGPVSKFFANALLGGKEGNVKAAGEN